MKLEHIGIAVSDAEAAGDVLCRILGAQVYKKEFVSSEAVETHFISVGSVKIELLDATSNDSALATYIQKHGEGLHHLAFEVDDIATAFENASAAGYRVLSDAPYMGADGKTVFFVHPKDTNRVLLEFCQSTRAGGTTALFDSHIITMTGKPDGLNVIVTGALATNPMIRQLEPSSFVHAIPNELSLTDALMAELVPQHEPFSIVVCEDDPGLRLSQMTSMLRTAEKTILTPSTTAFLRSVSKDLLDGVGLLLILQPADSAEGLLHDVSRFSLSSATSVAVLPTLGSVQNQEDIAGQVLVSFLKD